jgi:hypothetical protein
MRTRLLFLLTVLALRPVMAEATFNSELQVRFDVELGAQGQWIEGHSYGRVWRPAYVATGWRPYYHGHWEWIDEGWYWVSDEPWAWATYHYGRWAYDSFYGWVWVPGYQWAPAWVSWRWSGDVVGWAPLYPGFSVTVSAGYPVYYDHWTFVPCNRFVGISVHTVAYPVSYGNTYYHSTSVAHRPRHSISSAQAWGGPARPHVENRIGRPIRAAQVVPVAAPPRAGSHAPGQVPVYRPDRGSGPRPANPHGHTPGHGSTGPNGGGPPGHVNRGETGSGVNHAPSGARPAPTGSMPRPSGAHGGPSGGTRPAPSGGDRSTPGTVRPAPSGGGRPMPGNMRPAPSGGGRPAPSGGARPAPSRALGGPSGVARAAPSQGFGQRSSGASFRSAPSQGSFRAAPSASFGRPSGGSPARFASGGHGPRAARGR